MVKNCKDRPDPEDRLNPNMPDKFIGRTAFGELLPGRDENMRIHRDYKRKWKKLQMLYDAFGDVIDFHKPSKLNHLGFRWIDRLGFTLTPIF